MKFAFADIRSRFTELTAATAGGLIQTPKRPSAFSVSAKHSKNEKPLTPVSMDRLDAARRTDFSAFGLCVFGRLRLWRLDAFLFASLSVQKFPHRVFLAVGFVATH
jgi:hypothetical protein